MSSSAATVSGRDLEAAGIIPDVLPSRYADSSFALFPVAFAQTGAVADRGNTLLPSAARQPRYSLPPSVAASGSASDLYCALMYDPDGPSRRKPRFRNIVHLIHANIPAAALAPAASDTPPHGAGAVHLTYRPPGPPPSSGKHRYVWLLYRQAAAIDTSQLPALAGMSGGGKQKPDSMEARLSAAQGAGGGVELLAVNWHEAEWEPWVTEYMKEQFGWIAGPIIWMMSWFV